MKTLHGAAKKKLLQRAIKLANDYMILGKYSNIECISMSISKCDGICFGELQFALNIADFELNSMPKNINFNILE